MELGGAILNRVASATLTGFGVWGVVKGLR